MRKLNCLVGLLAMGVTMPVIAASQKPAGKAGPLVKVVRSADTLFKNADTDKNGTLTQAELKKIEKPLANKLKEFTADPQIERAMLAEHAANPDKAAPDLNGNDEVSPAEFKEFVLGALSSRFAATRSLPAANAGAANNAARQQRNNRRDDETAAQRRDRERQEDQDRERNRQRQSQMQNAQRAAQERDNFRPTPPPREQRPSPGRESSPSPTGGRESSPKVGGPGNKR